VALEFSGDQSALLRWMQGSNSGRSAQALLAVVRSQRPTARQVTTFSSLTSKRPAIPPRCDREERSPCPPNAGDDAGRSWMRPDIPAAEKVVEVEYDVHSS
jgi:hypothetical protein